MEENDVVESENNLEVADQEETVESTAEEVEETPEETEEVETEESATAEPKATEVQSTEDNKYARLARIQAEKEAEKRIEQVRKEAYEQGIAQGKIQTYIGKQNPYTGEIIKDNLDAQEYIDMFKLDGEGKDPISGYRELQKERAREEAKKQIELDEKVKQDQWYAKDSKDFVDAYSLEKLQEITKDEDFNLFANGKVGKIPLKNIYEDYQKLIGKYEKKSIQTAKQLVANNSTTPGAIEEQEAQEVNWSTMSSKKFEEYIEKAKNGDLKR